MYICDIHNWWWSLPLSLSARGWPMSGRNNPPHVTMSDYGTAPPFVLKLSTTLVICSTNWGQICLKHSRYVSTHFSRSIEFIENGIGCIQWRHSHVRSSNGSTFHSRFIDIKQRNNIGVDLMIGKIKKVDYTYLPVTVTQKAKYLLCMYVRMNVCNTETFNRI